jgi:hypothetical protein
MGEVICKDSSPLFFIIPYLVKVIPKPSLRRRRREGGRAKQRPGESKYTGDKQIFYED